MPDKLLAEWFWVDRWTGSSAFLLPISARGLYREMLSQAWRRGGYLPRKPAEIRRAVGVSAEEWRKNWPKVKPFWKENGQRIYNETQLEILKKARDLSEKRRRAGSKGGRKAQAKRKAKGGSKNKASYLPPSSYEEGEGAGGGSEGAALPPAQECERLLHAIDAVRDEGIHDPSQILKLAHQRLRENA